MHHDIPLISTTAMAFVVACLLGFAAHRLRLPALVGYLLAGVVIGPFSPGFVADTELAGQLAEMALLTGRRRSADVTAVDYCRLAVLSQRDFRSLLPRYPQLRAKLQAMAQQRAEMTRERREAEMAEAD